MIINQSIKMKIDDQYLEDAIFCDLSYGPTFGGIAEFRISSS